MCNCWCNWVCDLSCLRGVIMVIVVVVVLYVLVFFLFSFYLFLLHILFLSFLCIVHAGGYITACVYSYV